MKKIKNLSRLIKRIFVGIYYGVFKYKNIRVPLCNDFKVGIRYVYDQGVILPHPVGIVIGKEVVIGKKCTIYQNVTLGSKKEKNNTLSYPTIKDNVIIYANSVIFGDIIVGENSIIGAGSILFNDVPPNSIVAGNPAKIVKIF